MCKCTPCGITLELVKKKKKTYEFNYYPGTVSIRGDRGPRQRRKEKDASNIKRHAGNVHVHEFIQNGKGIAMSEEKRF